MNLIRRVKEHVASAMSKILRLCQNGPTAKPAPTACSTSGGCSGSPAGGALLNPSTRRPLLEQMPAGGGGGGGLVKLGAAWSVGNVEANSNRHTTVVCAQWGGRPAGPCLPCAHHVFFVARFQAWPPCPCAARVFPPATWRARDSIGWPIRRQLKSRSLCQRLRVGLAQECPPEAAGQRACHWRGFVAQRSGSEAACRGHWHRRH